MSLLQNLGKGLSEALDSYIQEKVQYHLEKHYNISLAKDKSTINSSLNAASPDKAGLTITDGEEGSVIIPVDTALNNGARILFRANKISSDNFPSYTYYTLLFTSDGEPFGNASNGFRIMNTFTDYIYGAGVPVLTSPSFDTGNYYLKFTSFGIIGIYSGDSNTMLYMFRNTNTSVAFFKFDKTGITYLDSTNTPIGTIKPYNTITFKGEFPLFINESLNGGNAYTAGLTINDGEEGSVIIPVDTALKNGARILFRANKISSDNFPSYTYYTLLFTSDGEPFGNASNGFRIMNTFTDYIYGAGVPVLTSPSFDTGNYYLKFTSFGIIGIYSGDSNTMLYMFRNTNTSVAFFKFDKTGITYLDSTKTPIGTINPYNTITFIPPIPAIEINTTNQTNVSLKTIGYIFPDISVDNEFYSLISMFTGRTDYYNTNTNSYAELANESLNNDRIYQRNGMEIGIFEKILFSSSGDSTATRPTNLISYNYNPRTGSGGLGTGTAKIEKNLTLLSNSKIMVIAHNTDVAQISYSYGVRLTFVVQDITNTTNKECFLRMDIVKNQKGVGLVGNNYYSKWESTKIVVPSTNKPCLHMGDNGILSIYSNSDTNLRRPIDNADYNNLNTYLYNNKKFTFDYTTPSYSLMPTPSYSLMPTNPSGNFWFLKVVIVEKKVTGTLSFGETIMATVTLTFS